MKLYKSSDIKNLDIEEVWKLYRKFVNNSQVDLISKFGFGRDIAIKAEKKTLYIQNQEKKFTTLLVV